MRDGVGEVSNQLCVHLRRLTVVISRESSAMKQADSLPLDRWHEPRVGFDVICLTFESVPSRRTVQLKNISCAVTMQVLDRYLRVVLGAKFDKDVCRSYVQSRTRNSISGMGAFSTCAARSAGLVSPPTCATTTTISLSTLRRPPQLAG